MGAIKRLGHILIYVADLDKSLAWYKDILGMEVVVADDDFNATFLSFGVNDHDIGLLPLPDDAKRGQPTFQHLAFEFEGSLDELKAFHKRLIDNNVKVTATLDHGVAYGIYFLDPDGHKFEVFLNRTTQDKNRVEAMRETGIMADRVDLQNLDG
jgi:catechol-2,3-dioxygenase